MKIFSHEKLNRVDVLDERFYQVGEDYYPSVTTVLNVYPKGQWFTQWLKDVGHNADLIRNEAADQGSNVHNAIEDVLNGKKVTWITEGKQLYSLNEWKMICRFMEFHSRYIATGEQLATETQLFSHSLKLGGTADLVCSINGETWLIDFKTSNSLQKTMELQLACYKQMWDEVNLPKIDRYGVLWLNAKTRTEREFQGKGWQLKEFTDGFEHSMRLYNHTRALWDEENPNYRPRNLSYPNSFKLKTAV